MVDGAPLEARNDTEKSEVKLFDQIIISVTREYCAQTPHVTERNVPTAIEYNRQTPPEFRTMNTIDSSISPYVMCFVLSCVMYVMLSHVTFLILSYRSIQTVYIKSTDHADVILNRTMKVENLVRSSDLGEHDAVSTVGQAFRHSYFVILYGTVTAERLPNQYLQELWWYNVIL